MSNSNCITSIPFSITGSLTSTTNEIDLVFSFNNQDDQNSVLAFEWYIDGTLLLAHSAPEFSGSVSCGSHTIGGRILTAEGWSGVQEVTVQACLTPTSVILNGPGSVEEGNSATYTVIATYADGTTIDLSDQYIFSATEGTFEGNIYHIDVTPDGSNRFVIITATKSGSVPLSKNISIQHRWYNALQTQQFVKNDCEADAEGTTVPYTVQAGRYSSLINQQDADTQALNEIAANGQENANLYGSCLVPASVSYSLTEQPDPYVDVNMQVKDQGVVIHDVITTESGSFKITAGHQLSAVVYAYAIPTAPDAVFNLVVKKNGVLVYNQSIPSQSLTDHPDAYLVYADTVSPADVYEINSSSYSAATINYTLAESVDPYADVNLQVASNGIDILDVYNNSSGSILVGYNNTVVFLAYANLVSAGVNTRIYLTVKRDGVVIYDQSNSGNPGDSLTCTEVIQSGAVYDVIASSTADNAQTEPYSYTRTSDFNKNNCTSGIGSAVTFSKTYFSSVSTADAENQANNDSTFNTQGQTYANNNGECILTQGTVIQNNVDLLPIYWTGITNYGNHYEYDMQINLSGPDYPSYTLTTSPIDALQSTPVQTIYYNPLNDPLVGSAAIMATSWNSVQVSGTLGDGSDGSAGIRSLVVFLNAKMVFDNNPMVNHIAYEVTLTRASGFEMARAFNIGATYDKSAQNSSYFSQFLPDGSNGGIINNFIQTNEQVFTIRLHIYKLSATTGTLTYEIITV